MIEDLWYKNAIIYSLDLETFMDLNADGIGDFAGLARRLDYLNALGVDTIWLAPFYPTPNKDNGYDITDYYGVDPRHGSSGSFVEFLHQAKKRGIKVIIDLVVNHTSSEHPWFQEARKSKDSKYRNWYIWSKKKPSDWDEGMVFPGVQRSTWTYDKEAKEYYFHRFFDFQPDLNMDNPEVREEIRRVIGYWVELGISGFRVDAVPFIIESVEPGKSPYEMKFEYLQEFRKFLQWRRGDAVLLGEANILPEDIKQYFGKDGDGIHMMFNFFVNQHMFYTLATADTEPLVKALEATRETSHGAQWVHFLRNHDELDIDRLTEEQQKIVFGRFAPDEGMRIFDRGIRRRLSPMLGNRAQIELAYSLMFSLPGTPVIRYGDEIGMGDNLKLKERNSVRTPMQWSEEPQAGFSEAAKLVHPIIEEGPYSFKHVNVEAQRREPNSLLNWMTALIRLRKECPEIGWGSWHIIKVKYPQILVMCYNWKGSNLVILHNFDEKAYEVVLDLKHREGEKLIDLMINDELEADGKGNYHIKMEAFGYKWFRTSNLSRFLHRSEEGSGKK